MKKRIKKTLSALFVLFILFSLSSCSLLLKSNEKSIWRDLNKHTIVDAKSFNSKIYVATNNEVLCYSIKNEILTLEQRSSYCLPRKSTFSDLDKIGILHLDEKLMVIQVNDYKKNKDTLYFIDSKTCQKISERELNDYKRIVFIKTNPYDLETSETYYLLAVPGSNIGISLEKVTYINQQVLWTYSSRYSGWNLDGVLFVDHDKLLLSDVHSDYHHYQINLISTKDGSIISQTLIEKTVYSNLRLTQVSDHTFFIFDFIESGITTSLWEIKPDNTLKENWSKIFEGVDRENISGFINVTPYIYFLHQDELSQDGTLWYLDLLKGSSIPVKMKEVPDEIHRASPQFVTSIDGKLFLYFTSIKPKAEFFHQNIFLINQDDGAIVWKKSNTAESYYDGGKFNIFDSRKTPLFLKGNTATFVWNEDKVEIINLMDGKSINLITRKGLYKNFNASFFIQDNEKLIWIRDNGTYEQIKIN